jgi:hypothetical protein
MEPRRDDSASIQFREMRHNPCLMTPISVVLLLILAIFSLLTMALKVPTLLLGMLLAPALSRSQWLIRKLQQHHTPHFAYSYEYRLQIQVSGADIVFDSQTPHTHIRTYVVIYPPRISICHQSGTMGSPISHSTHIQKGHGQFAFAYTRTTH